MAYRSDDPSWKIPKGLAEKAIFAGLSDQESTVYVDAVVDARQDYDWLL